MRDFLIVDEPGLRQLQPPSGAHGRNEIAVTRLRLPFKRSPGGLAIDDGIASGPQLAATLMGKIDFAANDLHLTGTIVPLFAAAFPIVPFPDPSGEGSFALSYRIAGTPQAPILRLDPGPLQPGVLRRLFEFRPVGDDLP